MALVKENIENLKNQIDNCKSVFNSMTEEISSIRTRLNNDTNYQLFVNGTDIGRELNDKLQKILDLQTSLNENEISNIITNCSNFVEVQEQLNESGE